MAKRNTLARVLRQKVVSFLSSCLVKCEFSVAADLLRAKRNQLDITKRGDLRLKLTKGTSNQANM